ncbi:MAG: bacteriophage abortive infection AbiH family protein [Bacteroidales bacterium]|nr:bacteriophage abortive infection AbiH family protein [Bacteroidales bacterium]
MVDLVIIGNGFDLAHGYKTGYCDFINWYIEKCLEKSRESGFKILKHDLIWFSISGEPLKVVNGVEQINRKAIFAYGTNDFFKKIYEHHKNSTWEGVEREYFIFLYNLVTETQEFYNSDRFDKGSGVNPREELNKKVKDLNECFSIIKRELIEYLGTVTPKERDKFSGNNSIFELLDTLFESCKVDLDFSHGDNTDRKIVLLNFNYTYTAGIYHSYFVQRYQNWNNAILINIHGVLNDHKSIIFGYGDESDKRYSELEECGDNDILTNFKSFEYFQGKQYSALAELLEKQKYNVHIMGHSCGVSDRVLLKELFCTDNCQKIQIYYHRKEDGSNDYKDKTMNISRIFPLDQKAEMRKKIVNIRDCNPL